MARTILCINKKQFGIGIVVTEGYSLGLQFVLIYNNNNNNNYYYYYYYKSAQTVAPNLYWETPLNHNSYTTEYPVSAIAP